MLALLRLDAAVLLRNVRSFAWIVFLIGTPALVTFLVEEGGDPDDPLTPAGWMAGMAAFGGMVGWFMALVQVENLTALAPIPVRVRTLHHVLIGAIMSLPAAGVAGWADGATAGLTAGLMVLAGILFFAGGALLMDRLPRWIHLPAVAVFFFAPPFAVGAQLAHGIVPHALPVSALAVLLLILLYVGRVRGLEMGGTWDMQHDVRPRARGVGKTPSAPAPVGLDGHPRPAPLWILFKAVYLRWFSLLYAGLLLGVAFMPGAMITICLLSTLAVLWPLQVWAGFQASPLPRMRAALVLLGPVFLLWICTLGVSAVVQEAGRETAFVWADADSVHLGHPDGWSVASKLDLHGGGTYRLPDDPAAAAERTSYYLDRVFGLRVPAQDILALRPAGTGRTSGAWLEAVEARYAPEIRGISRWIAAFSTLGMFVVLLLYAGLYYLPSRHRSSWGTSILLAFFLLSFLPSIYKKLAAEFLSVHLRDFAAAERWAVAAALGTACLLLIARHFVAFLRLETSTVAWTVTSGGSSSS
ncbi:MAG TPA: hypothetical protein VEJ18_12625 [Planctomycetota bacterium]|nr:hypothetical protein [Planctomycetota bacterium]